jgi:hypothetical protein
MLLESLAVAAFGGGISLFGASQAQSAQRRAAAEQNRIAEERANAQFERAEKEYEIDWQQQLTNYYWEQALTEQSRKTEALAAVDQASYGTRLIWSAAENYQIKSSALYDQFVVGEQLRYGQEVSAYQQEVSQLQTQATLANLQTQAAVARYMSQVAENGARADLVVAQTEGKVDEVITALAADEMAGNFRYEMEIIAGVLESASRKNVAVTRSGGGKVAKQAAMNAMKESLRNYAAIDISRRGRMAKVGQLNSYIQDEQAKQIAILATQSEGYEEQASLAQSTNAAQIAGINSQLSFAASNFNNLTLPSFGLAANQYGRELAGLQIQTINQFQNALLPYRQRETFDPLGPIKGLAPEYYAPTKVYEPGGLSFGQGISSFLSGAQSFSPSLFNTIIPNALANI